MRKFLLVLCLILSTTLIISGCQTELNNSETVSDTSKVVESSVSDISEAASETSQEEVKNMLTNLTFSNKGTRAGGFLMGDLDGPAYCVYSKIGYNKASFEVNLGNIEIDLTRNNDSKHINAYMFLGADIYDVTGSYWQNCIDAGLVKSGNGSWHIFHSLYSTDSTFTGNKWYESSVKLSGKNKYRIELDASKKDGEATLTVYDLTNGGKVADSVTFQLQYALKDGKNIRIYQDYALDYPPDTKFDTKGNVSVNDWEEITLYNTDQGMFMKNVRIENVKIFDSGNEYVWGEEQTQERGMWPDTNNAKLDYEVVKIKNPVFDSYIWFDFDMNR